MSALPDTAIERFRRLAMRKVAKQEGERRDQAPTDDEVCLGNAVLMLVDEVERLRRLVQEAQRFKDLTEIYIGRDL